MREKNEGQNLGSEFYLLWFIIFKSGKKNALKFWHSSLNFDGLFPWFTD